MIIHLGPVHRVDSSTFLSCTNINECTNMSWYNITVGTSICSKSHSLRICAYSQMYNTLRVVHALSGHTRIWKVVQAGCLPGSLMLRPHPAHLTRRSVVSQAWPSFRNVKQPIKLQSSVYRNNVEARTNTSITPLKVIFL